ncbi:hypothetical protein [Campylobacter suis]|uniref:Phage protein n=1 Tax=Campylobacter suis TaxID=2790657 RepID=A0ABN7KAI6_9BACT|nr:hypothetical protein [Campylobacter suis]CAD7288278.1 hypothetical protein LMG8286_01246 [Campylobacter suis]
MRNFNIVITDERVMVKTFRAETLQEAKDMADIDYTNAFGDEASQSGYKRIQDKEYEIGVELTDEYLLDEVQEAYWNFAETVHDVNETLNDWVPESVVELFGKNGKLKGKITTLQSTLSKLQQKIADYEKVKGRNIEVA